MFKLIIVAVAVLGTYMVCTWLNIHGLFLGAIMALMGVIAATKLS